MTRIFGQLQWLLLLLGFTTAQLSFAVTFSDTFSSVSYGNQDGTVNWSTDWIETGDNNSPNGGNIMVWFFPGVLVMQGTGGNPTIEREADISAYSTAVLSFDYSETGFWEGNDQIHVDVSDDGGLTWHRIHSFVNDQGIIPQTINLDVSAYISANFRVRFVENADNWAEIFYIDNLVLTATGTAITCITYRDEFGTQDYTHQDGSANWTNSWTESGDDGSASSGDVLITGGELSLEGDGVGTSIEREANLAGYTTATLTLYYRETGQWEGNDEIHIDISNDGGVTWTRLHTFTNDQGSTLQAFTADVSGFVASNFRLRFVEAANSAAEIFYFDNVEIEACGAPVVVDHYSISYTGSGLTCEPITVTITGHDASEVAVAPPAGTTIALSTSTGQGLWSNPSEGVLVDNGGGSADYTFAGSSSITLSFNHPVPGSVNFDINAASSPSEGAGSEDPSVMFVETALRIVDELNNPIPNQIAAKPSPNTNPDQLYLQAIRTDNNSMACVGVFAPGASADIDMALECINPSTCIGGTNLSIDYATSSGIATASLPAQDDTVAPTYSTLSGMLFGADSKSPIVLTYPEAGQIQLHSRYETLDGTGSGSGQFILGDSTFAVSPVGFCVAAQSVGAADPACTTTPLDQCTPYVAAGASFDLLVAAKAWQSDTDTDLCDNATTQNFASTNVTLVSNLVEPAAGVNGSLSVAAGMVINSGAGGGEILQPETFSEVGVFTFDAEDNNYFGDTIVGSSVNVGRFIPDHFQLVPASPDAVVPGNGTGTGITYLGQPFTVSYSLLAQSALSPVTVTQNYRDAYAKLDPDLTPSATNHGVIGSGEDIVYGVVDTGALTSLNTRLSRVVPAGLAWNSGVLDVTDLELTISRAGALEAPFNAITIGIKVNESDGVDFLPAAITVDTDVSGTAEAAEIGVLPGSLLYGRTFVPPVYGPEINAGDQTPIPFAIQFFNGTIFVTNTSDSSSLYGAGATMDVSNVTVSNHTGNINPADVTAADVSFPNPSSVVIAGEGDLISVSRPGVNKDGTVDIRFGVDPWLQYNWNGTGDEDPMTTVTFGTYRGHDRIIYWRELH